MSDLCYKTRHTQCVVRLFLGVAYVRSLLIEKETFNAFDYRNYVSLYILRKKSLQKNSAES